MYVSQLNCADPQHHKLVLNGWLNITGSIAHTLFTYIKNKKPDWDKKLNSIYNSNFKGNEFTRYLCIYNIK